MHTEKPWSYALRRSIVRNAHPKWKERMRCFLNEGTAVAHARSEHPDLCIGRPIALHTENTPLHRASDRLQPRAQARMPGRPGIGSPIAFQSPRGEMEWTRLCCSTPLRRLERTSSTFSVATWELVSWCGLSVVLFCNETRRVLCESTETVCNFFESRFLVE